MSINPNWSADELLAYAKGLEAQLNDKKAKGTSFRVGEKGGMSFYGLQRFPVTQSMSGWLTIIESKQDVLNFLNEHFDEFTHRGGDTQSDRCRERLNALLGK
jgi:hypothetical protein